MRPQRHILYRKTLYPYFAMPPKKLKTPSALDEKEITYAQAIQYMALAPRSNIKPQDLNTWTESNGGARCIRRSALESLKYSYILFFIFRIMILKAWMPGPTVFWVIKEGMLVADGNHRLQAIKELIEEAGKEVNQNNEEYINFMKSVETISCAFVPGRWSISFIRQMCLIQNAKESSTVK